MQQQRRTNNNYNKNNKFGPNKPKQPQIYVNSNNVPQVMECPHCGILLEARLCKNGQNSGEMFWACENQHQKFFSWVNEEKNRAYAEKKQAYNNMDRDRTNARTNYQQQPGFQKASYVYQQQQQQQQQKPLLEPDDMPIMDEIYENPEGATTTKT
jgi:hypothetical protein